MPYTICFQFKGEHIVYAGYTICTSREHIVYGAFCGSTGQGYSAVVISLYVVAPVVYGWFVFIPDLYDFLVCKSKMKYT